VPRLLPFVGVLLLVDMSAYSTISPLLPSLSDEHDLDKAAAGVLGGAFPAGTLLLALPAAALASRIGARATVITGLGLLAAASLAFGLADSAGLLIGARFLQGVSGACTWAGGFAWLTATTPPERRGEAIGSAMGAAIAGALIGPVAGALAEGIGTLPVFCGFVVLSGGLAVWALRLPYAPPVPGLGLRALRALVDEPRMRSGMWLMLLPGLGFGVIGLLVPLELDRLGATAVAIAAMFLVSAALESVASPLAGRLADRRGRLVPARIGLIGMAVGLALLPLPERALVLAAAVIATATIMGLMWAPAMALVTDGAEAQGLDHAFAFGLTNLAWGVGATVGALGGGALAEATDDAVVYLALAALAAVTVTALALGRRAGDPVVAHRAGRV